MRFKKIILLFIALLLTSAMIYYFLPEAKLPSDAKVDKLILKKNKRELSVFYQGKLLKTYHVSLGRNPKGHKQKEGDKKTPEGLYFIDSKNPQSGYHRNLGVSYPNKEDILNAKNAGVDPGGEIKIHGLRNGLGFIGKFHWWFDWTAGCIALTDQEIDELYRAVEMRSPILIQP